MRHVIVIGGGVTGLVAARALGSSRCRVTLLEATGRLGGQVRTVELNGARVDVGAEAVHLATPQVARLVDDLGLRATVVGAAAGPSLLKTRKGLVPLPAGVGPAGPTQVAPVLASGILRRRALVRAGLEPVTARLSGRSDVSVGAFVRRRFGREVADVFVDPLLGNLHGGDIDRLSLRATAPQLVPAAEQRRSLLLRRRRPQAGGAGAPVFATWPDGLATLIDALARDLDTERVEVRTSTPVNGLSPSGARWTVRTATGEALSADTVVLAVPAPAALGLLRSVLTDEQVPTIDTATVATVVLGYPAAAVADNHAFSTANGLLLGRRQARTLKAATFLSHKWPHLAGGDTYLVRASVGRAGSDIVDAQTDEALAAAVHNELVALIGLDAEPVLTHVERWPHAMPQLTVGHGERMRALRAELATLPPLVLAGAPFDGLGIGSTVQSGLRAAEALARTASGRARRP